MANIRAPHKTIGAKQAIAYTNRFAARLILTNSDGKIALIYVKKGNYFKLPGGGIEQEEDRTIAAKREALEETGCEVDITTACIATVEEWRNDLHQVSYCYGCRVTRDTKATSLTADEIEDGLQCDWVSLAVALDKVRGVQPTSELGLFIKERDTFFLELHAAHT